MNYCRKCGKPIPYNKTYCTECTPKEKIKTQEELDNYDRKDDWPDYEY